MVKDSPATLSVRSWDLKEYSIEANTAPQNLGSSTQELPFIAGSLAASAEEETDWFGIVYNATEGNDFWVYELYDAGKGQLQITLNETLGITKGMGCDLIGDEQPDEKTTITQYEIVTQGYDLVLNRTMKQIEDPNLPSQQRLVITFDVENRAEGKLELRFSEQHRNIDRAFVDGSGALLTVNQTAQGEELPILVQSYQGESNEVEIQTEDRTKKASAISTAVWGVKTVERKFSQPRALI